MKSMWRRFFALSDYENLNKDSPETWSTAERLFCTGAGPIIQKAQRGDLNVCDLWAIEPDRSVPVLLEKYKIPEHITFKEFLRLFFDATRRFMLPACLFQLLLTGMVYVNAYLIGKTLRACNSADDAPSIYLFVAPVVLLLMKIAETIFGEQLSDRQFHVNQILRGFINTMIYRKMINLSPTSRAETSASKIDNIIQQDLWKISQLLMFVIRVVTKPLNLIVSSLIIFQLAGWPFVCGLIFLIVAVTGNGFFNKFIAKKHEVSRKICDQRVQLITDIFNGIQVIKLYGWENSLEKQVERVRQEELKCEKIVRISNHCDDLFITITPFLTLMSILYGIVIVEKQPLTPELSFFVLYLFDQVSASIKIIPRILKTPIEAWASLYRIANFLNMEEAHRERMIEKRVAKKGETAITLKDANFSWSKQSTWTLSNINLSVKQGQLVAVVGRVGSGKTALLSSLAGNLELLESIECKVVADKIGWCEQKPWIQNKTLRENILFDSKFDEQYYSKCIEVCALKTDLELLEKGDETLIGERGVNLSGGQRARVGLARAVYQKADFYLLDDPLSAVDAAVARHIFNNVIGPNGMLSETTRLISVNSTQFLPECDLIVVLNDGEIFQSGTYSDLIQSNNNLLLSTSMFSQKAVEKEKSVKVENVVEVEKEKKELLIEKEKLNVVWSFWFYAKTCGLYLILLHILFSAILVPLLGVQSSLFMARWTSESNNVTAELDQDELINKQWHNFFIYFVLEMSDAFAQLIGHLSLLFGSFRACSKIHETLMHAVIRAPMSFFDVTPVGEILRRFNRDINAVDQDMRSLIIDITREASNALRLIVPLMLVLPSTSVPILMTAYTVYWFNRQYKNVVPTFYKLDRVVGAFQYTTIYDSWAGSATINGLHMSKDFIAGFGHRLDQRLQVNVAMIACHNWVRQRLTIAIYTLIGSWILLAVWSAQSQQITAGILALVITKGLDLCEYFPNAAQSYRWVQETAESIERINEYSEKEPEPMWIENKDESIQVPVSGNIEFRNVSVRYKSDSPLVLRSLSFKIESGQKIGVVGRTGAGKTTITSALFRLVELEEGEVLVGDVNIKRMGSRLRHHLTIIPQDPILFTGNVRTNLDPANQFKDEQLFEALERIGFLKRIQQLDNQLSHEIKEGGSNFSVGERQLFCLARALLRPTRFLVLDEASAHLDLETDHHIQQAIREHFAEATVLTIAHRLNTLANYDKIMVIDAGQLVEFDSFLSLLSKPDGYLTRLVNSKSQI